MTDAQVHQFREDRARIVAAVGQAIASTVAPDGQAIAPVLVVSALIEVASLAVLGLAPGDERAFGVDLLDGIGETVRRLSCRPGPAGTQRQGAPQPADERPDAMTVEQVVRFSTQAQIALVTLLQVDTPPNIAPLALIDTFVALISRQPLREARDLGRQLLDAARERLASVEKTIATEKRH